MCRVKWPNYEYIALKYEFQICGLILGEGKDEG